MYEGYCQEPFTIKYRRYKNSIKIGIRGKIKLVENTIFTSTLNYYFTTLLDKK